MRSPRALRVVKAKKRQARDNHPSDWEFNTYKNGGSISLPSKDSIIQLIEVCDVRYYDHLATSEAYKDSILVLWENKAGEAPAREPNGAFNYDKLDQLRLEIYHIVDVIQCRKILGITFHLTG